MRACGLIVVLSVFFSHSVLAGWGPCDGPQPQGFSYAEVTEGGCPCPPEWAWDCDLYRYNWFHEVIEWESIPDAIHTGDNTNYICDGYYNRKCHCMNILHIWSWAFCDDYSETCTVAICQECAGT
jgi:hypothetical protein